jgi:hypothetical protein
MQDRLEIGFRLDRQWYWMRGELQRSKQPDLEKLARVLQASGSDYAVIGGVALQIHQREPRTTLDIDVAVKDRTLLPARALEAAGFKRTGQFANSENWVGPDATPVQFTDDPQLHAAVMRAGVIPLGNVELKVIGIGDLLHEKLRAASDPARRRSKRLQDLADAQSLVEQEPSLETSLSEAERALLGKAPP